MASPVVPPVSILDTDLYKVLISPMSEQTGGLTQ